MVFFARQLRRFKSGIARAAMYAEFMPFGMLPDSFAAPRKRPLGTYFDKFAKSLGMAKLFGKIRGFGWQPADLTCFSGSQHSKIIRCGIAPDHGPVYFVK
jgi:hypothetical protein